MAIARDRRPTTLMRKELTPATVAFPCAEFIADRDGQGKLGACEPRLAANRPGETEPAQRVLDFENSCPARRETEALASVSAEVVSCERCPRLVEHSRRVAAVKRKAYLEWEYWGRPVPSFGDPEARLLLIGLAPGAHGANRTGRIFTGDSSGDFLYKALYETGFASQPSSTAAGDGLMLKDCYIASAVRCAPPQNRPLPAEFQACRGFLLRELQHLRRLRAVLVLGRLALDAYLSAMASQGVTLRKRDYAFAHGAVHHPPEIGTALLCSYHPSRQNTQTGRLTMSMMIEVLQLAKLCLAECFRPKQGNFEPNKKIFSRCATT